MVRIHKEKKIEAYRQAMSAPVFAIFEKIVASEIDYNAKLAQLTLVHEKSMKLSYSPADVYHDEWMSADAKGLDKPRQFARRTFTQTVADLKGRHEFRDAKIELLREHGTRLVDMGAVAVVDALPVSWPSKQALELMGKLKVTNPARSSSSGSQRGPVYLPHMSYKELLVRKGLIELPLAFAGRKPSCGCYEARLTLAEQAEGYDWANWFMRLAGFQAPIMRLLYWLESWDLGVRGVICVVWGVGGRVRYVPDVVCLLCVKLCYVKLCYVEFCYGKLCYVKLCYVELCYVKHSNVKLCSCKLYYSTVCQTLVQ